MVNAVMQTIYSRLYIIMRFYILIISTIPALLLITWISINPYSLEVGTASLADVNVKPIESMSMLISNI